MLSNFPSVMAFIQSGQNWQFSTEADLEEIVWHNLPKLLNLRPLSRQFSISGKFCDILAVDEANQLVVIELKNTEDRYVVQQLVRYYDAIQSAETLPFEIATSAPRLVAISPSFHADTLTDCRYCTLKIELMTFSLESSASAISLSIHDADGDTRSTLRLSRATSSGQPEIQIPEPPRKLLNWLSPYQEKERDWTLGVRKQLLTVDPRMKEVVEANRIFYGKGKSKPCCELRRVRKSKYRGEGIDYYLWLPSPENKPHVIRMAVGFDLAKQRVTFMGYSRNSAVLKTPWYFPECVKRMKRFGYQRSYEQYKPFLKTNMTISPTNIVNLALQTWQARL